MSEILHTCSMSKSARIVVLDPNEALAESLGLTIRDATGLTPCVASSAEEAVAFVGERPDHIFAAVVGFEYEEAQPLLNTLTENGIPAIAYGTNYADDIRKNLSTISLSEVVTGEGDALVQGVGRAMARLVENQDTTILVVDDSRSMRMALIRFLATRRYKIVEATNGIEALKELDNHPTIKLVITDNEMPEMDGFSLIREIRKSHSKDDLAGIGISAKTNSMLSVKFISNGANDFLHKPFVKEELYCRVDHNLDMLKRIETIRDLSYKDPLTRLYNRRYFFENAEAFVEQARAGGHTISAAMIDIDFFKNVNDTYGHDGGDEVLKKVASIIQAHFEDNAIVSRFGGEEFCILSANGTDKEVVDAFEQLRAAVEDASVNTDAQTIKVTISIGVCTDLAEVEFMLKMADGRLYMAKESGRNKVISATPGAHIRSR